MSYNGLDSVAHIFLECSFARAMLQAVSSLFILYISRVDLREPLELLKFVGVLLLQVGLKLILMVLLLVVQVLQVLEAFFAIAGDLFMVVLPFLLV